MRLARFLVIVGVGIPFAGQSASAQSAGELSAGLALGAAVQPPPLSVCGSEWWGGILADVRAGVGISRNTKMSGRVAGVLNIPFLSCDNFLVISRRKYYLPRSGEEFAHLRADLRLGLFPHNQKSYWLGLGGVLLEEVVPFGSVGFMWKPQGIPVGFELEGVLYVVQYETVEGFGPSYRILARGTEVHPGLTIRGVLGN
jgi:hypothetical protein